MVMVREHTARPAIPKGNKERGHEEVIDVISDLK
jgi:hypothetical protein